MKFVSLVLATAVTTVIGSAPLYAQSSGDQSSNNSQSGSEMNAPTHPGWQGWDRDRDWDGHCGWGSHGCGRMGPGMMGPRGGWTMGSGFMGREAGWHHHHHRHARGAHFVFQRGNARIDIQCPANQSVNDCVSAAGTLIDKVESMERGPGHPPPPPGHKPPPPGQLKPAKPTPPTTNGSGINDGGNNPGPSSSGAAGITVPSPNGPATSPSR